MSQARDYKGVCIHPEELLGPVLRLQQGGEAAAMRRPMQFRYLQPAGDFANCAIRIENQPGLLDRIVLQIRIVIVEEHSARRGHLDGVGARQEWGDIEERPGSRPIGANSRGARILKCTMMF
jgi:hypothetical protein